MEDHEISKDILGGNKLVTLIIATRIKRAVPLSDFSLRVLKIELCFRTHLTSRVEIATGMKTDDRPLGICMSRRHHQKKQHQRLETFVPNVWKHVGSCLE